MRTSNALRMRVLVVDDNADMRETLRYILEDQGDEVVAVATAIEALAMLSAEVWDLVVLDKNLDGPDGGGAGLDLLEEVSRFNPSCRVILVTGFADLASVERAFARGAFDYLEKNALFETMLRHKAKQALEPVRELRRAALQNGNREDAIRQLWSAAQAETDARRKGALLEDLMALVFRSVPGFESTTTRLSSDDEEIDLWIPNSSLDPLWQKEKPYLMGECKHWSRPVDRKEADAFFAKLERRKARVTLGFYIAPGGVSAGFRKVVEEHRREDKLVIMIDRDDLSALVMAHDRNATLKDLHSRAMISAA